GAHDFPEDGAQARDRENRVFARGRLFFHVPEHGALALGVVHRLPELVLLFGDALRESRALLEQLEQLVVDGVDAPANVVQGHVQSLRSMVPRTMLAARITPRGASTDLGSPAALVHDTTLAVAARNENHVSPSGQRSARRSRRIRSPVT